MLKNKEVREVLIEKAEEVAKNFSGVFHAKDKNGVIIDHAFGFANRSEELPNTLNTRFGIASGCKLFTAVGICQLVENGQLTFETRIKDCLHFQFPRFSDDITIHHLLTHTAGIPDYFDEDTIHDFEDLWKERPMYSLKRLEDFLPMFQNAEMMFNPGEKFHYNNAGFILLGLIIEKVSGKPFIDYIMDNIFKRCEMNDSGYFSMDHLPKNTAHGYIDNKEDGTWRTNIYSVPIKGGADGGAFITAPDMMKFWDGLLGHQLLGENYLNELLKPHVSVKDDNENFYGYGIWVTMKNSQIFKYHIMGYDPGVSFHSCYYPQSESVLVVPSNKSVGAYQMVKVFEEILF